jgi:hypothetical protein
VDFPLPVGADGKALAGNRESSQSVAAAGTVAELDAGSVHRHSCGSH